MAVVTHSEVLTRLRSGDLIISPILDVKHQVGEGSVNLRLGTTFIDTRVREHTDLDPEKLSLERIKKVQEKLQLPFGSTYVLHPHRLVLAGVLEFICLPPDLCGYVVSRSRYGRAGLMVATATYIQPAWKGCLTLELFNYGDFPIVLHCGSQVAQLILEKASPKIREEYVPKKLVPLGPEFSRMDDDADWSKLSEFGSLLHG